jgi:hypothetical protein
MQRVAVVARLKPGSAERARELIAEGPPFDPEAIDLQRHVVYLSDDVAVFVFEGGRVNALVRAVARGDTGTAAFAAWEPILAGIPRLVQEEFSWERAENPAWAGAWGE